MYGAKRFSSTLMRCAFSASQCASSPSPSDVAMPMPVIQASIGPEFDDFGSVMGDGLLRKADAFGHGVHVSAQVGIRERNVTECERRVASQLAVDADLGLRDRKTRAFMYHVGVYFQQLARRHEAAHLGFLDHGQKR